MQGNGDQPEGSSVRLYGDRPKAAISPAKKIPQRGKEVVQALIFLVTFSIKRKSDRGFKGRVAPWAADLIGIYPTVCTSSIW